MIFFLIFGPCFPCQTASSPLKANIGEPSSTITITINWKFVFPDQMISVTIISTRVRSRKRQGSMIYRLSGSSSQILILLCLDPHLDLAATLSTYFIRAGGDWTQNLRNRDFATFGLFLCCHSPPNTTGPVNYGRWRLIWQSSFLRSRPRLVQIFLDELINTQGTNSKSNQN